MSTTLTGTNSRRIWGPWTYDGKHFLLTYKNRRDSYAILLDRCQDSAEVLDWILQLRKTWTSPEDLGHLVRALGDIFQPQGNMCAGGQNRQINPRTVAAANGYPVPRSRVEQGSGPQQARQRDHHRPTW